MNARNCKKRDNSFNRELAYDLRINTVKIRTQFSGSGNKYIPGISIYFCSGRMYHCTFTKYYWHKSIENLK